MIEVCIMGKFCANCGNKLTNDARFCPECGTRREGLIDQNENNQSLVPATTGVDTLKTVAPEVQTPPPTLSERVIPLVLAELAKAGSLPNYNQMGMALLKLKQQEPSPMADKLLKIAEYYKEIATLCRELSLPMPGTMVQAAAVGGTGTINMTNNGNEMRGNNPQPSDIPSNFGHYAGTAAAGFIGTVLANLMMKNFGGVSFSGNYSDPLFDYQHISLADYLSSTTSDLFYTGLPSDYVFSLPETDLSYLAFNDGTDFFLDDESFTVLNSDVTGFETEISDSSLTDNMLYENDVEYNQFSEGELYKMESTDNDILDDAGDDSSTLQDALDELMDLFS